MKNTLYFVLIAHLHLLLLLLLLGCEKNNQPLFDIQSEVNEMKEQRQRIPQDLLDLSEDDVRTVANLFIGSYYQTRSENVKEIKSILPVYGEEGILMYAVNFNDGYILISATTNFYPILAIVEHGSFSIKPYSGQEIIINELKTAVSQSKQTPIQDARNAWRCFMESSSVEIPNTRVGADYYMLLDGYLMDWHEDDRTVYYLNDQPDNMPDDMYELFCESASMDMPVDYPYMDCAIITEKYCTSPTTYGPFLQTLWHQHGNGDGMGLDYNSAVLNNMVLGCETVAVGQIMRYFEYPPFEYNWSAMPNTTSNTVLSSFLATLRSDLQVDDNGKSTYLKAKNTLENYGYSVTVGNHSATDVCSSLLDNRPVYMRGYDSVNNGGHAWVCDGYYSSLSYYEYKLYIVRVFNGQLYDFAEWESDRVYNYGPSLFHMNWGWGGSHNGYYFDNSIQVILQGTPYNFTTLRKDMLVSTPSFN